MSKWVTVKNVDFGHRLECQRCGSWLEIKLPLRAEDWTDAVKAFSDKHAECPEVQDVQTAGQSSSGA